MDTDDPGIPEDPAFTHIVVCQEIGHSVGLDHSGASDSCMAGTSRHLNQHDIGLIDANY